LVANISFATTTHRGMVRILLHETAHPVSSKRLRQMFELRHRVFKERLEWTVSSENGMERDCYDDMGPIYCLCEDESGEVIGCWRLLKTVTPYLLRDVFPQLLGVHAPPASPRIWEGSRFAYYPEKIERRALGGVQEATSKLIAALLETGLRYDIDRIIAVSELRFERVLKRSGLVTHRFGPPIQIGNTMAVAGWFDVTRENLQRVREVGGIGNEVLTQRPVHVAA